MKSVKGGTGWDSTWQLIKARKWHVQWRPFIFGKIRNNPDYVYGIGEKLKFRLFFQSRRNFRFSEAKRKFLYPIPSCGAGSKKKRPTIDVTGYKFRLRHIKSLGYTLRAPSLWNFLHEM